MPIKQADRNDVQKVPGEVMVISYVCGWTPVCLCKNPSQTVYGCCQHEGGQTKIGNSQVICSGALLPLPKPQLEPLG